MHQSGWFSGLGELGIDFFGAGDAFVEKDCATSKAWGMGDRRGSVDDKDCKDK